jgi:potassium uptake Trk family protein
LPGLSNQVTVGRNSNFGGLTPHDREELGGVEYRSLKLLLKVIVALYAGLHIFGIIGLVPWILHCASKYREVLASNGQNNVWWAIYSTQTMISNLGFTLTPDSMVSFRDASWPMVLLTFLAFAGNTCHPIILRFILWVMQKLVPRRSSLREPLQFLLDHPRRCYTLLFPRNVTWILFGILFVMNFIDALLIVVLDLDNPEVNALPMASRILAATFQAASARHTGTASFNLAKVNPAVQFSLLTMMYIAVFPIAMSVRGSNTYEESALGRYATNSEPEESQLASSYMVQHIRNQLSFDLWYIFLGTFCICIAQAKEIADPENAAFSVFAIMFECVSAYGNVGLSLGTNSTLTSLSGDFTVFSKLVICAVMLRGRHRGLPYALDHAVMLPGDQLEGMDGDRDAGSKVLGSFTRAKTV